VPARDTLDAIVLKRTGLVPQYEAGTPAKPGFLFLPGPGEAARARVQ
jgi:hypothetical protein